MQPKEQTVYLCFGFTWEAFIENRTSWAMYGTSILTTSIGSQSWWRLPTWSRNVDKQYVFGCIRV